MTRRAADTLLLMLSLLAVSAHAQTSADETASLLRSAGKHLEAAAVYRQAIVDAGDGPASARTIILYSKEAACYRRLGRHEPELAVLEECRTRLERAELAPGQREVYSINVLVDLSRCLQNLGRLRASMRVARSAADLAEVEESARPALAIRAFNELGLAHQRLGRLPEALDALARTRELIVRLAPASPELIGVDINLLQAKAEFGQLDAALEGFEELDRRLQRATPALQRRFWMVPQRLGLLHFDRGDHEKSLEFHERALASIEDAGLEDTLQHALAILDGTYPARRLGRFRESLEASGEALEMLNGLFSGDHPQLARGLHCRAASLLGLRRADSSRPLEPIREDFEAALAMCRRLGDQHLPAAIVALGRFHLEELDDLDRAEELMREAIERAETLRNRAFALGDAERASYFRRVRLGRELDPYEGMAQVMVRRGRIAEAVGFLERSRARSTLDKLRLAASDPAEAMRRRALEVGDRDRLAELDAEEAALARTRGERREFERASEGGVETGVGIDPTAIVEDAVERRGIPVAAAQPARIEDVRALLGEEELLLFYDLRPGACRLFVVTPPGEACTAFDLADETGGELPSAALAEMVAAYRRAIRGERRRTPGGRGIEEEEEEDVVSSTALGHALFRLLIPDRVWSGIVDSKLVHVIPAGCLRTLPFEALVVAAGKDPRSSKYWVDVGPPVVYAASGSLLVWAVERRRQQSAGPRATELVVLADPDFATPETNATAAPRGVVVTRVDHGRAAAVAGLRVGDVITHVGDDEVDDRKDFAGEGALVLRFRRAGRTLTRTVAAGARGWTLADRPAPAALAQLRARTVATRDEDLAGLPGTREEAARIEEMLAGEKGGGLAVTRLTGVDAHESLLHAMAPRARILHLATHQVAHPDGRWGAGRLALTRTATPTRGDDGYLDLDDLLLRWGGRLDRCELVVLSACRSRLGKEQDDEGLFAIPWGFQTAGCPAIVASLWPVDDEVTAKLMSAFYACANKTTALDAAALRAASKAVRRDFPAPYHWAPFVWIGAPR